MQACAGHIPGTGCAGPLIDSHCHLNYEPLYSSLEKQLADAMTAGVQAFIVPAVHPNDWQQIIELSRQYNCIKPACGIHPMHAGLADNESLNCLTEVSGQAIAIGEIGLDALCGTPLDTQESTFRSQLRLAIDMHLPVLVHCRKAFEKTLRILREEQAGRTGGVMHAFSGSVEMAREFIKQGFGISISTNITWPDAHKLQLLARLLPEEQILIETDAPFMAPRGCQKGESRPAMLAEVLHMLAQLRSTPTELLAAAIHENSRRIFRHQAL